MDCSFVETNTIIVLKANSWRHFSESANSNTCSEFHVDFKGRFEQINAIVL